MKITVDRRIADDMIMMLLLFGEIVKVYSLPNQRKMTPAKGNVYERVNIVFLANWSHWFPCLL